MRAILLVVLAACGSGTKSAADAYVSPQQCEATFEGSVDRACTTPADCTLLTHPDCCGDVEIGVNKAMLASAMSLETTYASCENASCGARGCAHQTMAEDGQVPSGTRSIVVVCTNQACSSAVQ